ncbi:hypothetical protein BDW02DRAFT_571387 [Decorospora gaudefroyi]|uniref:Uncharacterized protein n=1 Tax=Decorospora gaudefroyi TaxID=184978 RepID=A0A6A5K4I2_9PLEO|nr:hypothetical protein BDW02DRAFT_571387 [Decorospora gaudefroyi]
MPPPPPPSNPPHPPPTPNAFLNVVLNNPAPSRTYEANNEQAFITATQRSLQARGKDFTTCNEKTDSNAYAERQRRDEAASILESEEVVMWVAAARGEVGFCTPLFMLCWFLFSDSLTYVEYTADTRTLP